MCERVPGRRLLAAPRAEVDDYVGQHADHRDEAGHAALSGKVNVTATGIGTTRVGTLELRVPRVRAGSHFPGLLESRKRAERALVATVREAYVQGVSTRRVDDLVKALGLAGISKS